MALLRMKRGTDVDGCTSVECIGGESGIGAVNSCSSPSLKESLASSRCVETEMEWEMTAGLFALLFPFVWISNTQGVQRSACLFILVRYVSAKAWIAGWVDGMEGRPRVIDQSRIHCVFFLRCLSDPKSERIELFACIAFPFLLCLGPRVLLLLDCLFAINRFDSASTSHSYPCSNEREYLFFDTIQRLSELLHYH